ncbi:trypsin-like serine protease [Patulibacter sp. SYSU D01012]|uniref:S1 family peptidase n=1 Tax=Patulibacter sp. SYSU D01012 TaxID=2817381 RepID=UPI001B307314|nr:trypsin-like serine protease [Patulibacter sp. SYSU D01012]
MHASPARPRPVARRAARTVLLGLAAALAAATPAAAAPAFPPLTAQAAPGQASARIVGGTELKDTTSAPYTVALQTKFGAKYGSCSGTILDPTHILTAAHCVVEQDRLADASAVVVAAGTANIRTKAGLAGATVVPVAKVRVHPRYRSNAYPDDVAVLTLGVPIDLTGPRAQALPMADAGAYVDAGRRVRVTGFGVTSSRRSDFGRLRSVYQSAVTAGQCGTDAPAAMLCTYRRKHAACSGDSGGTATVGSPRRLVGVTDIAVRDCAVGLNLFANVAAPEIRVFIDAALAEQDVTEAQTPLSPRGGLRVRVSGDARAGRTVSCVRGFWAGAPQFRYSFFRLRNGRERDTGFSARKTYRVKASDRGWRLGCAVRAENAGGVGVGVTRTVRTVR